MRERSALSGAVAGAAVGMLIGLAGFALTTKGHGMGAALFLMVPVAAGFTVAIVTQRSGIMVAALMLALFGSLLLLIVTGKEGVLCALMAFPLISAGLAVGALLGYIVRRWFLDPSSDYRVMMPLLLILPFSSILLLHRAELRQIETPRTEEFVSSVRIPAQPEDVWKLIEEIDNVSQSKILLMRLGLPTPTRCTLERRQAGARRTCYFEKGAIEEVVTEWHPPSRMKLDIVRSTLPGRHWLGFKRAEYDLQSDGTGTTLVRKTTISSTLYPAWYWRYLESIGVKSEHEFIFREMESRLRP